MTNTTKINHIIFLLCITLYCSPLFAEDNPVCLDNVCFNSQITTEHSVVPLLGTKSFTYYFFHVYDIALYGPTEKRSIDGVLSDVPKSLILHYHRDFSPEEITYAADQILKENPDLDYQAISDRIKEINKLYQGVKPGDRYELRYEPKVGTTLLFNGQKKGTIPGSDFAKAYFGIWLSKYPISSSLRDSLILGRS